MECLLQQVALGKAIYVFKRQTFQRESINWGSVYKWIQEPSHQGQEQIWVRMTEKK